MMAALKSMPTHVLRMLEGCSCAVTLMQMSW